jgi:hypothetical protein
VSSAGRDGFTTLTGLDVTAHAGEDVLGLRGLTVCHGDADVRPGETMDVTIVQI